MRVGSVVGATALVVLLAALGTAAGLSTVAVFVGSAGGVVLHAVMIRGLARFGHLLDAADLVTLIRAMLACGVAALVVDAFLDSPSETILMTLTVVALVLDAVDGWVARLTRTSSAFGRWFDGEVDAFLMLVLSVYVTRTAGLWVLAIGAARYAFGAAAWVLPWMRGWLPPRYWRRVVTAVQGIVLAVAAADLLPSPVTAAALVVALGLLLESFGRDVVWLWRHRVPVPAAARPVGEVTDAAA